LYSFPFLVIAIPVCHISFDGCQLLTATVID
jgi:hypothetical protein